MGKIISTQDLIEGNINSYIQQTTEDYSRYLQYAPTFVTYYKKNYLNSTSESTLESVREVIGSESPIQFDRILDFAIYGFEESMPNVEMGEFGLDTEMGSDAIILPNTIKPTPDDFFTLLYNGEQTLFRVVDVSIDRIKSKPFYKITYELDERNTSEINEQIEKEFTFVYENLGTEDRTVILTTDVIKLNKLNELYDKFYSFYIKAFLNDRFNIISFKHNDKNIYNRYLIKFIKDNTILEKRYNFLSSVVVTDVLDDLDFFDGYYGNTIYHALETMSTNELTTENFKLIPIPNDNYKLPFYYHYETFYQCYYEEYYSEIKDGSVVSPHNHLLVESCKRNVPMETTVDTYKLENILISYINRTINAETLLDEISNIKLRPYLNEFLLIPCIMYIVNQLKNDISNNKKLNTEESRY